MSTVICLPGLGADDALFEPQRAAFDHARVPDWPDTDGVRTFDGFASALLTQLRADGTWKERCTLVGFSFGGQVALSMTRIALEREAPKPSAIVLVSSTRSNEQITGGFRAQVALSKVLPASLIAWAARTLVAPGFARSCGLDTDQTRALREMAARLDAKQFKRLATLATRWTFDAQQEQRLRDAGITIAHLHSLRDPVIPAPPRGTPGVTFLPEQAHLLTWTHADRVNAMIRGV
ncbi:MAG: hypothetical protein Tsb0013_12130 [Phycisphaerales bacterium]